ncbi:uncharacterized protein F4807DRAFT_157447 [Annulohypoxylon truncatum]|uniref:uncharacterized protein n=1 Tax=Annulohypoxylon truncatum TaxID=327061 RepID=UPI00200851AB|nr:uncharacterized protein F4807DRAFT_157447 [Annulohypoxylon truncatum]KAI1208250.1 hypothetical protein F4807DRAFT_157447 [Annulohypoxylon truncatum]
MARELLKWASTRWSLSRCLLFARVFQVSGTLVTAVMNGFLLVYIHVNRLGLTASMFCLEMMVCAALIYSGIVLLLQHSGTVHRRSSTQLTTTLVAGDVVLNGIMIAIMTVLARAGLPTNCYGLTRSDSNTPNILAAHIMILTYFEIVEEGDAPTDPPKGYGTIRFGDGHIKGVLDKYCGLEQSFYFIAAVLIFTYMLTVTLGVLRIFEQRWNLGQNHPLFTSTDDIYQLGHIRSKIHSPNPSRDLENADLSRERVLTPPSRTDASLQTRIFRPSEDVHRNQTFREQAQSQPLPVSPVSAATSPISQVSPISPATHHHRSFLNTSPGMLDTSMGGLMIDHSAEAMVTDGYRPRLQTGMQSLPPYSPGQSRGQFMDGHGNESNEMRLSEYVKGETRAQHMKDSGMGM